MLSKFGNPHVEYSACRLTVLGYIMLSRYRPRKDARLATLRLAEIMGPHHTCRIELDDNIFRPTHDQEDEMSQIACKSLTYLESCSGNVRGVVECLPP